MKRSGGRPRDEETSASSRSSATRPNRAEGLQGANPPIPLLADASVLLAEEEVIADRNNDYGYPVGTVIGNSTYLERTIVDAAGKRP